jgi:hypothetical protein
MPISPLFLYVSLTATQARSSLRRWSVNDTPDGDGGSATPTNSARSDEKTAEVEVVGEADEKTVVAAAAEAAAVPSRMPSPSQGKQAREICFACHFSFES